MTLYEWHLVLDDEFGEPLWGIEERDEMIAAGVLVPVEPDRAKLFEAFDQCEEMETEAEVVDHLLVAILGVGGETP